MLSFIKISNYVLIESAELEFAPGFNVFTGESGAGKSILMSAVDLLLGGRADHGAVRGGCSRAEISGIFVVPENLRPLVGERLDSADIPFETGSGELCIRRVLTPSAVRNYVNDSPVGAKFLADLGALLIDRHGAGEQLSLLHPARQLELLDRYGSLVSLRAKCAALSSAIGELDRKIAEFEAGIPDAALADRLALMVEEISRVDPAPGEDRELEARHRLASNAQLVLATASELSSELYEGENAVADRLGNVVRRLGELEKIDENSISSLVSRCVEIQEFVSDLSRDISDLASRIELDPAEFAALEERMASLHTLKRRYAPSIELLLEAREKAEKQLDDFRRASVKRKEFLAEKENLKSQLSAACGELSKARKKAAAKLVKELVSRLEMIGFTHARLEPEFSVVPDSANGSDRFELLFSANLGEELRPLRKIASSGELSRIMLAFKIVLADSDAIPTVVFDEIDMNIGGAAAEKVGEALSLLARSRQILSISHLAQVASKADRHFLVEKSVSNGRTFSTIRPLTDPTPELARMSYFLFGRKESKTKKSG
ncbi:MAG: DNA repair protein RecN [Lentisphaeria bacterium]|nr:DNA repair protein RecN [Lentisphaeria bacterium]